MIKKVLGSEFKVLGSGFRGSGFRGSGFKVLGSGFGVRGYRFWVLGSGLKKTILRKANGRTEEWRRSKVKGQREASIGAFYF
jgi:hypothetical protein